MGRKYALEHQVHGHHLDVRQGHRVLLTVPQHVQVHDARAVTVAFGQWEIDVWVSAEDDVRCGVLRVDLRGGAFAVQVSGGEAAGMGFEARAACKEARHVCGGVYGGD